MNRRAHAVGSGLALAIAAYIDAVADPQHPECVAGRNIRVVASGGFAALCGSLPDLLEPATHPGHRQFFHSVAFAGILAAGLYQTYHWRPDDPVHRLIRGTILVAGGAYLVHLAMDATTPKSLPLLGKI